MATCRGAASSVRGQRATASAHRRRPAVGPQPCDARRRAATRAACEGGSTGRGDGAAARSVPRSRAPIAVGTGADATARRARTADGRETRLGPQPCSRGVATGRRSELTHGRAAAPTLPRGARRDGALASARVHGSTARPSCHRPSARAGLDRGEWPTAAVATARCRGTPPHDAWRACSRPRGRRLAELARAAPRRRARLSRPSSAVADGSPSACRWPSASSQHGRSGRRRWRVGAGRRRAGTTAPASDRHPCRPATLRRRSGPVGRAAARRRRTCRPSPTRRGRATCLTPPRRPERAAEGGASAARLAVPAPVTPR